MKDADRQAIVAAFYGAREKYEKLAAEIRRLLDPDIDPSAPADAIYTINHRIKDEHRLIEKIEQLNRAQKSRLTAVNFQESIEDLLGIRIVCLRLSDVDKVETFLASLEQERKIRFIKGPERKKTFLLRVDPRGDLPDNLDLQYSGYSSVHYVVQLGGSPGTPEALAPLKCEVQVRTILEEAWGEIDHKYRYEHARSGLDLPDYVNRGFYSFAAYLQAAALQAEHLCQEIEKLDRLAEQAATAAEAPDVRPKALTVSEIRRILKNAFGFTPTERTLAYTVRRLKTQRYRTIDSATLERDILLATVVDEFRALYEDVVHLVPFSDEAARDIDLINAFNFALFRHSQGRTIAEAGARAVLISRFSTSFEYQLVLQSEDDEKTFPIHLERLPPVGEQFHASGETWEVERIEASDIDGIDGRIVCRRAPSG